RGQVDMGRVRGMGDLEQLPALLKKSAADLIVITLPWAARDKIMQIVEICAQNNIKSRVVPDLFQLNMRQVHVENLEGIPLLGLRADMRMNPTRHLLKRAIDLGLVILAAPFLAIPILLVAIAIKMNSAGPVLYRQKRVGEKGRTFWMYKFRS